MALRRPRRCPQRLGALLPGESKRYGTSASHLELVDEDDDVEEELGKEDGSFWKDLELEYEESGSESE
ncbi:unnamed protein product [Brassica oleracea var. botrytis]